MNPAQAIIRRRIILRRIIRRVNSLSSVSLSSSFFEAELFEASQADMTDSEYFTQTQDNITDFFHQGAVRRLTGCTDTGIWLLSWNVS